MVESNVKVKVGIVRIYPHRRSRRADENTICPADRGSGVFGLDNDRGLRGLILGIETPCVDRERLSQGSETFGQA